MTQKQKKKNTHKKYKQIFTIFRFYTLNSRNLIFNKRETEMETAQISTHKKCSFHMRCPYICVWFTKAFQKSVKMTKTRHRPINSHTRKFFLHQFAQNEHWIEIWMSYVGKYTKDSGKKTKLIHWESIEFEQEKEKTIYIYICRTQKNTFWCHFIIHINNVFHFRHKPFSHS